MTDKPMMGKKQHWMMLSEDKIDVEAILMHTQYLSTSNKDNIYLSRRFFSLSPSLFAANNSSGRSKRMDKLEWKHEWLIRTECMNNWRNECVNY